ncbi:MAG: AGE family epimerase/isomerase [Steroidobacteraceae bacterium]
MATTDDPDSQARAQLAALRERLVLWLTGAAYPLWAQNGIDPRNGGFIETLGRDGAGLPLPRRARVQPRQIYAFAQAPGLGWTGDARRILLRGIDYFTAFYRRADGLFRTLAGVDGTPLDERAFLYDQAFALLGFAAAATALDARGEFERRALELRQAVDTAFRASNGAFHSGETREGMFESNPHMHLLEACLAWAKIGQDPGWSDWAGQLVELATQRFIRRSSGALGECFTADWRPSEGLAGCIVEPGHQFEWAWLLMRSEPRHPGPLRDAALRLIAIGEKSGVHNQVAINALLEDLSPHDSHARFWPQTERLKAALMAAELTGDVRYWSMAAAAAASLLPYLETPVAGLWLDVRLPSGELVDSPSPASTFYHLVGAIVALDQSVAAIQSRLKQSHVDQ